MFKLHTHKEQFEHLQQDLLLLDKQFNHNLSAIQEVGEFLPVGLLINDQRGRNIYMNKLSEEKLRYCREELDALGNNYIKALFPDPDYRDYMRTQIDRFHKRNDHSEVLCMYQKITPKNQNGTWMLVNSKLFSLNKNSDTNHRMGIAVVVKEMGEHAKRIAKVLDDNVYMRKNFKKFAALTKREKEILSMVALGFNNPQIAEQLFISRHTVEQHRKNINRKLEFKTYRELILFAEVFELI